MRSYNPKKQVRGFVRPALVRPGSGVADWQWCHRGQKNTIMKDFASLCAALLRNLQDGNRYYIGGMYFEFINSPSTLEVPPTFELTDTAEYYRNLSGIYDFLRMPLITSSGSKSSSDYSKDNVATFYAQTTGVTGFRDTSPLTFSDVENSLVIGGALVAFLDPSDATQDLLLSRFYFEEAKQIRKVANKQIGLSWSITL